MHKSAYIIVHRMKEKYENTWAIITFLYFLKRITCEALI